MGKGINSSSVDSQYVFVELNEMDENTRTKF